jgi:biotin carboxyl carrier protein
MHGMILNVNVKQGDQVKEHDTVAVIEAMKMQNEIKATHGGTVKKVYIFDGDAVTTGDILMVVE